MAANKRCITSFILSIIVSFLSLSAYSEEKDIIIGADQWCPFFCQAGEKYDGFSIELLQEALRIKGLKSTYTTAPFDRVTRQVETGHWQIHGATDAVFTPSILIGKEPVAYSKWVFVVRKGTDWVYKGVESLKGKRFGAISGYVYSDDLMNYYRQPANKDMIVNLASESPQQQVLRMLIFKRFDFIVEDESVVRYWTKKLGLFDQIEFVGVDSEVAFFPGYRKNDEKAAILAQQVDSGIRQAKKNSALMKQLIKKYDIAIWK